MLGAHVTGSLGALRVIWGESFQFVSEGVSWLGACVVNHNQVLRFQR